MKKKKEPDAPPVLPKHKLHRDKYGLTPRQRIFVREYMFDMNATQAAIRAGYKKKNADVNGPRLAGKGWVKREIERLIRLRERRCEVRADQLLNALKAIALSDPKDYMQWDDSRASLKCSKTLSKFKAAAIKSISKTHSEYGTNIKIDFHEKIPAIKMLAQHIGLGVDDGESKKLGSNGQRPGSGDDSGENVVDRILEHSEKIPDSEQ